jgi:hypothetical protein
MSKVEDINRLIQSHQVDTNLISDGYHAFGELYEHRIELFIALCKIIRFSTVYADKAVFPWKSHKHSDGSAIDGWFVMGIDFRKGEQITYHLPDKYWERCWFAHEYEQAPEWDGHTSNDVLERLRSL